MVGVRQKALAGELEVIPVVTPAPFQGLKFDEPAAVPFKNTGVTRMAGLGARKGDSLGKRQKMASVEAEIMPLLRGERRDLLEENPGTVPAPVDLRRGVEIV